MASFGHSPKRSACDRCRSQKLRCSPRQPGTSSCHRCARLGAHCGTSTSYPVTSSSTTTATLPPLASATTATTSTTPATQTRHPPTVSASSTHILPKTTSRPSTRVPSRSTPARALESDGTATSTSLDSSSLSSIPENGHNKPLVDIFSSRQLGSMFSSDDALMFFESVNDPEDTGGWPPSYHDLHDLSNFLVPHSQPHPPALITGNDTGGGRMDYADSTNTTNLNPKATAQSQSDDWLFTKSTSHNEQEQQQQQQQPLPQYSQSHRLSSISLALSGRLRQCLAILELPQSLGSSGAAPSALLRDDMDMDMKDSRQEGEEARSISELFGDALSDTAEFLAIIQSYGASDCSDYSPPQIGIIATLSLLSTYLQIVTIFKILFQCLCKQLFDDSGNSIVTPSSTGSPEKWDEARRGSGSSNHDYSLYFAAKNNRNHGVQDRNSLQTLPGLRLASFSVQQGNLQTKILVHAVLHQFEMMERTLGLTAELCISDKRGGAGFARGPGSGLFDQYKGARALLEAVSDGRPWTHQSQQQTTATVTAEDDTDNSGLRALASLREMIERVQKFLNE